MFILNHEDKVPLYRQLYQQISAQVLSGTLVAHTKLPSVRDLANELSISRNSVEGAYQELYAEGYIYSRQRSGYYIAAVDHDFAPAKAPVQPSSRQSMSAQPALPYRYDFHPARLDPASFPVAQWRSCYLESLRESALELSHYGDPQGDLGLRNTIRQYLERSRGVICAPGQIIISAGLQQSLELVSHLLASHHVSIAIENPGYHLPRAVFRNNGYTVVPVAVKESGLDLEQLRASDSTFVYVTPSHQLPMGCVMPIANRLKLIEWASAGDRLIIEDDYDSELRYHGKPIPSLQGLRPDGNIIYLGTFSKVLSPALRMSYLVLPPHMVSLYRNVYGDSFATVSLLEQKTMAKFMEQGHWLRHIRRMRIKYQKKHDTLLQGISHSFGSRATVIGQGAGLHVILQLRDTNPGETEIIRRAAENGIYLFPFSTTCSSDMPYTATNLFLGFGGMSASDLEQGIDLLSRLCF